MKLSASENNSAISAAIYGRVQGVAFRFFTQRKAQTLNLTGYVRNEMDGSVSVYCEGPADRLALFASWLKKGPTGASVTRTEMRKVKSKGCRGFKILF